MSRAVVILNTEADRKKVATWATNVAFGTRVEFKAMARSTEQNAGMWVLLTELATKLKWHGMKLTAEDYKDLLTASLRKEIRQVPNAEGTGFVLLGMRTSDMTVPEMSDFIELIYAFGAQHGIQLPTLVKASQRTAADHSSPGTGGAAKGEASDPASPPERPVMPLAADLSKASAAEILAWADVLEARLRQCAHFEIDGFWQSAANHGRLAALARVSPDRYRELNALSAELRQPKRSAA